jgi:Fe-S-cluster containining protein
MTCRIGCAACCIAVSISSPLPGMPGGKPAGARCANLDNHNACVIHGKDNYPKVCGGLQPSAEMCGNSNDHAFAYLADLEIKTAPATLAGKTVPH